jgi:predicted ATP-grasp superfamily ATP-dependent carboligase
MPTVLLTLGRLPKALDLCRAFAAAGWRVVVAEPHEKHLCGASRSVARSTQLPAPIHGKRAYLEALAAVARAESADIVIPVSEETLHVAFLRDMLPGRRVLTMPPDLVLALHHKGTFIEIACRFGASVPETRSLGSAEAAAMARQGRVVIKPVHSCAGRGVRVLAEGEALPPDDAETVVQQFVPGTEFSTCTLAHEGTILGTAIYRGAQFAGTTAIAFERVEHPAIADWVTRLVTALNWSGFIAFDLRVDESGRVFGIECNPRATSGLHFFDQASLAPAIVEHRPLRFRAETRLQQFWSCLTETQLAAFRLDRRFGKHLRNLLTTRDVCWSARDPLPLLTMPYTAWPILREAAARRVPFGEVATLDVGWFE